MKLRWIGPAVICAAALAASTAMAQHEPPMVQFKQPEPAEPASATVVAPVTVTMSPAEFRAASSEFVQSYAASTPRLDQIPRWRQAICVQSSGGTLEQASQLLSRIEAVARLAGQKLGKDGCAGNATVLFSNDPQATVDNLAAQNEIILGYYHHIDFNRLKTVTRPIQAWYMTSTAGSSSSAAGGAFASTGAVGRARNETENLDDPEGPVPTGCNDSRFSGCLQSVFAHVLVVVDSRRVANLKPNLVADYVAMLIFSQPKALDRCTPLPSVIDLFAACPGRARPEGLTSADRAYLSALYKANPEVKKLAEQSEIAGVMAQTLIKDQPQRR
jgi:hypothetical protein